jgi:ABC-type antimicrobial peptide transport system permease subunit
LSPNYAVYIPYTYFQRSAGRPWDKEIRELRMKIRMGVDPDTIGEQVSGYFVSRYGTSATFNANSNAKTVDQMKLFLNVFSLLLTAVAVIALIVGGIGINNMMLVNLADRLNEIGLRKALGAGAHQIRAMVLTESLVLSLIGGGVGLVGGFFVYHLLIYLGSHIVPNTQFAWVIDPLAIFAATATMIATGIFSGLYPALKADRMQVIDALRRE